MQDNTVASIANIINNLKNKDLCAFGIADGQKVLIAAVETGCVSTGIANELSKTYELGLHWDAFAQAVEKFLLQSHLHIRELANHFEVAESSVKKWSTGIITPPPNMCNQVIDYIHNRAINS